MIIETKRSLGDKVWLIEQSPGKTEQVKCGCCDGIGDILGIDQRQYKCPVCWGKGTTMRDLPRKWHVVGPLTIGQITIEVRTMPREDHEGDGFEYMLEETGVPSGTVYQDAAFFDSQQEALRAAESMPDDVQ